PETIINTVTVLTDLREIFLTYSQKDTEARSQRILIAEISLEDFAFILFSELFNKLEHEGQSVHLFLQTLSLLIKNIILTTKGKEEVQYILKEIDTWQEDFTETNYIHVLRLKATLERALRFTHEYGSNVIAMFYDKAVKLGSALDIDEHAVTVYCEDDIRSNLVFQLSKFLVFVIKYLRNKAGLQFWDTLVPGSVIGYVQHFERLEYYVFDTIKGSVIALVDKIDGDEYIKEGIAAVVIPHDLPHLSHFAIRARQSGTTLVCLQEIEKFSNYLTLVGQKAFISAFESEFTFDTNLTNISAAVNKPNALHKEAISIEHSIIDDNNKEDFYFLSEINIQNGGQKAGNLKMLYQASQLPGAIYKTPNAIVLPFGLMHKALNAYSPQLFDEYISVVNTLEKGVYEKGAEPLLLRLKAIISEIPIAKSIVDNIKSFFHGDGLLVVRSSSNCEDLETMSGAGLYESVVGVKHEGIEDAVRYVWASLWLTRAFNSRVQYGISQMYARMAVIVQKLIMPDYAFIMHSVNPINRNSDEVYVELAPGLGETLTSSKANGSAYRIVCKANKDKTDLLNLKMLSFANYSNIGKKTIDYTKEPLTINDLYRKNIARRLFQIAICVEETFDNKPQDIEGVIVGDDIYVVQSRNF
ncbi:MAG: hypothetical protein L3V56_13600, partial [Candidatus Magnetoovum sp. WYHC-5]|nr:hypothetical protein [Candidatus Magnetoovum sp. WYHC-5]